MLAHCCDLAAINTRLKRMKFSIEWCRFQAFWCSGWRFGHRAVVRKSRPPTGGSASPSTRPPLAARPPSGQSACALPAGRSGFSQRRQFGGIISDSPLILPHSPSIRPFPLPIDIPEIPRRFALKTSSSTRLLSGENGGFRNSRKLFLFGSIRPVVPTKSRNFVFRSCSIVESNF